MVNDQTPHSALPLPHPSNDLADDVLRLRAALTAIDGKFLALDTLLSSDDATLDSVMELVASIKANRDSIQSLVSNNATKEQLSAETRERLAALNEKQDKLTEATQSEMEAGTESAIRSMSPLRVKQAIAGTQTLANKRISAFYYLDKTATNAATTGAVSVDLSLASAFSLTLSGATSLSIINAPALSNELQGFVVRVTQGATAYSLTWWSGITWLTTGGTPPAAPAANKTIEYVFTTTASGAYLGRKGAAT